MFFCTFLLDLSMSKSATVLPSNQFPSPISENSSLFSSSKDSHDTPIRKNRGSDVPDESSDTFSDISSSTFAKGASGERGVITAIDVGTNSFHAIVASVSEEGVFTIQSRAKENVRLGESVSDMKYLSDEAMKRGIAAMKRFAMMAAAANAPIRAIGTSAMREALNQDEFVRRVQKETGVAIEVISGNEEARLIYLGVLQALPILNKKTLVIDVGGGSTETIVGYRGEMLYGHSAKLGAIRLTRRFFSDDKITPKAIKECRDFIRGEWALVFRSIQVCGFERVVASSGTAQTLASVALAKKGRYNPDESLNGVSITKQEALEAIELILKEKNSKKRSELAGMDPKRADIIVGGALILEQAITRLNIQEITISDYALREGILFDHYQKQFNIERYHHLSQLRYKSVQNLCDTCQVDINHAEHVCFLALQLFDALHRARLHSLGESERELLEAASLLHDVGYHISADQHHKHSYYIIRNTPLLGFTNNEEELIANIARYHRKSHPKAKHENYVRVPPEKRPLVNILAGILRITEGLDRRRQRLINTIVVELQDTTLRILLSCRECEDKPDIELWSAERRTGLLEEVLGKKIVLEVR
ncbi:MAG: Ppx/GppA family phosphatase [Candidatus Kapaibacterium sp.]|nr:MAG: Ppx/GppA family phosphatase [Candidatus Kapabacteria bacterium]